MSVLAEAEIYHIVQKVGEATVGLCQIAKEYGMDIGDLSKIWAALPIDDQDGMTYLELADLCILEVSRLVDNNYSSLTSSQRTAKKFKLMSCLLNLKADQFI